MRRRDPLATAAAAPLKARGLRADVPTHNWAGYDHGPAPSSRGRLNQGPFGIEQDEGWFTLAATTPSEQLVPNFGMGLVGYTWEEGGAVHTVSRHRASHRRGVQPNWTSLHVTPVAADIQDGDLQLAACRHAHLVANTQPDISHVGNREVVYAAESADGVSRATIRSGSANGMEPANW